MTDDESPPPWEDRPFDHISLSDDQAHRVSCAFGRPRDLRSLASDALFFSLVLEGRSPRIDEAARAAIRHYVDLTRLLLAALPARIGAAFVTMGRIAVSALGGIRTALVGLQVVASMLGSLVVSGVARGFAAIPVIAARAVSAIPAMIATAWGAVGGIVASGAGLVGRALIALPGLAVAAGGALVSGIGSAVAALPGLFFGAIGMVATAVQAIPGLVSGGFAVLRSPRKDTLR